MSEQSNRAIFTRRAFTLAALAAAAQPGLALQDGVPTQLPETQPFAVTVNTDAMEGVPAAGVYVGQGGMAQALTASWEGDAPTIDLDIHSDIVVRLDEAPTWTYSYQYEATTIGQHFTLHPETPGADGLRLDYFQPTARKIGFYPPYGTSDFESGWMASGSETATYGFEAYTAELPTNFVISNYFAYEIGMHVDLFQHGLLLRCDEWVDLGAEGINFFIDRAGYDYGTDGPEIFALSMSNPGYVSYVTPTLVSLDAEKIDFQLFGYLAPGDNLILFNDPNPGGIYPADPLGTIVSPATGGDCNLPDPPCVTAGTCNPPIPAGATHGGPINCVDKWKKIGPELKPSCGSSQSIQVCSTWKGGVSFKVTLQFPGGEIEVGADGEVGGTKCTTTNADGGWKVQTYQCFKQCSRLWDITWIPWYSIFPRHGHKTTHCVIPGGLTTATCQFDTCE